MIHLIDDNIPEHRRREEYLREAKIMKRLSHENVMSIIGITFERDMPMLILPFMEITNC